MNINDARAMFAALDNANNPSEPKEVVKTVAVGQLRLKLTSEVYDGKVADTRVTIDGTNEVLCHIAGNDIKEFTQALSDLVKDFAI